MAAYLFLKVIDLTHGHQLGLLLTPMGLWYLVEVAGFTLVPSSSTSLPSGSKA